MNRLFINSLWLFCSMLPLEAWTQGSISRSAIEKLADLEPIGQQVMQFDRPDATFPMLEETDAPYVLEYVFVNRGGKPLTIDRVTVSCGCLSAEYASLLFLSAVKGVFGFRLILRDIREISTGKPLSTPLCRKNCPPHG